MRMTRKLSPLRIGCSKRSEAAASLTARKLMLACALVLAGSVAAQAQFSGPALRLPSQPNQVQTPAVTSDLLTGQSPDLVILPGDALTIRIFGSTDFSPLVTVGSDGTVQIPLIGVVQVSGLSITRAEDLIARRLIEAGMYKAPAVTIQVTEAAGQFVSIEGEVKSQIVPISGQRRLLDVLAFAGGLPPTASHLLTILRPGVEKPIVVDLGTDPARSAQANIAIFPRDTILVSRGGRGVYAGRVP